MQIADHELSAPYHMVRRTQVITTGSRNNVLSHKKTNRTDNQTGRGCGGRVRERGEICVFFKYIVDGSRLRLDF